LECVRYSDVIPSNGLLPLTRSQQAAIAKNPNLAEAFRGAAIDDAVKAAAQNRPEPKHLFAAGKGIYGPDFVDAANGIWYDITTPAGFMSHLNKYSDMGAGVGLFTK
jgi:hypothetical protein